MIMQMSIAQNQKVRISGYVTDILSGETLIGAGVFYGKKGAATNEYGYYTFTLPCGKLQITASHIGYENAHIDIELKRDTVINIKLKANSQIKEAIIAASKDSGIKSTKMSAIEIPVNAIKNIPALFGEHDVLKAIQLMPGVQAGTEGLSGIYVRGGGPDENLIMLDGVPLYNGEHMLGLFSIFQPEAIKNVTLYKGSFPARYGGRSSSIIDIRTNDGNMNEFHGLFSIGLLNDKLHFEGPIIKNKTTFSISARGLHTILFEPLIQAKLETPANYYFFDTNAKLTHKFSDKDRLFLNIYYGKDEFYIKQAKNRWHLSNGERIDVSNSTKATVNWGNTIAALRWNHVFNNKLFSNITAAYTGYKMYAGALNKNEAKQNNKIVSSEKFDINYNSGMRDFTGKMDFDYTPLSRHLIKFGAEYIFHTYIPETLAAAQLQFSPDTPKIENSLSSGKEDTSKGHEISLYIEDDFKTGKIFTINPGIRLGIFNTQKKTYFIAEPRLSIKADFDKGFALKTAYTRMSQFVHLLSSTQVTLPMDLWVPITANIKPIKTDQVSFGIYNDYFKGWEFSLEAYFKYMQNILEYKDGASFFANSSHWEDKVEMGNGRACGLEFFIQKTMGKTTGWLGYTLSWSDRIFPEGNINGGKRFPYKYDRRHNLSLVINRKLGENVDFSATWVFATGGTLTIPERKTQIIEPDGNIRIVDYIESRNNYRLPPSHRLNLTFAFHKKHKKQRESIFDISMYNVYNNMNPNFVLATTDIHNNIENGENIIETHTALTKITILPIIPSISYTYKF